MCESVQSINIGIRGIGNRAIIIIRHHSISWHLVKGDRRYIYIAIAILILLAGNWLAEQIVLYERFKPKSVDAHLTRTGVRIVTLGIAIVVVLAGAHAGQAAVAGALNGERLAGGNVRQVIHRDHRVILAENNMTGDLEI